MNSTQQIYELENIIHNYTVYFLIFDSVFFLMLLAGVLLLIRYLKFRKSLERSNEYLLYTINGQEKERARIARELHDTVAQDLRFCKALIEKDMNENGLLQLNALLTKSISQIRLLSYNLAPTDITKNNLGENIINLCNYTSKNSNISIRISIPENTDFTFLTEDENLNLYRVVQESINNALKHSEASEIVILIRNENGTEKEGLYIFISDDGCGFDIENSPLHTFGIIGMKQRCQLINAELKITSSGEGTQIDIFKQRITEVIHG